MNPLSHLFAQFNLGFLNSSKLSTEENLLNAFERHFDKEEDKFAAIQEVMQFVTSPEVHGRYPGEETERPGYFSGLPYAPALNLYFVRTALYPKKAQENFDALIKDINQYAEHIYNNNPRKPDLDKIVILKPSFQVGVGYYPTKQYIEGVIRPYMERLGIETSPLKDPAVSHDHDATYAP
jgi:hypothetical protein